MELSKEVLDKIHDECIIDFLDSFAPETLKRIARDIKVTYRIVNRPRAYYYAVAFARSPKYTKITGQTYLINKKEYLLVIEVNKATCKKYSKQWHRNLIKHELSHIIEIVANKATDKFGSWSDEYDHACLWKLIYGWFRKINH